jgi:hypothetical protein
MVGVEGSSILSCWIGSVMSLVACDGLALHHRRAKVISSGCAPPLAEVGIFLFVVLVSSFL